MLRYASYDIVFQEVPGEVTLAINLSGCPNRCSGCHSPHLRRQTGDALTKSALSALLDDYGHAVTCVCFMGGDDCPQEVLKAAEFVRQYAAQTRQPPTPLKTAWYSGKARLYANAQRYFDYVKLGEYLKERGGLRSPTTNQRFYRIENETLIDMTAQFYTQSITY